MKANQTLGDVKRYGLKLDAPIYVHKPYVVVSDENIVLAAGTIKEMMELSEYFDDNIMDIRRYDMDANDNTKVAAPFEIIRHSKDSQGLPIVDFQGIYLNHKDAAKLRDELNRLMPSAEHAALEEVVNRLNLFQSNYADFDHHPEFKPVIAALANLAAIQGAK